VSTVEQGEGYSPEGQRRACRDYADRQQYRVVRVLGDAESGRTMDRPAFQYLMHLARNGAFDVLIVWKGDRLARNELGVGQYRKKLRAWGVRVESVQFGPQPDTPASRFSTRMVDLFAEFDRENIVERTTQGRFDAARDGQWPCRPPYGYTKTVPGKASPLVLVPEQAERMRRAYAAAKRGANREELGRLLGMAGRAAQRRLHNPAYKGRAEYAGIPVPCPAIVDEATWQAVMDGMAERHQSPNGQARPFARREAYLASPTPRRAADDASSGAQRREQDPSTTAGPFPQPAALGAAQHHARIGAPPQGEERAAPPALQSLANVNDGQARTGAP
jgi:DNA invertase Pin-like site-specific DNA recombinase